MKKTLDQQAAEYTHSVWSGKKYDKPRTHAQLAAESMKVLRSHPTIGKLVGKPLAIPKIVNGKMVF